MPGDQILTIPNDRDGAGKTFHKSRGGTTDEKQQRRPMDSSTTGNREAHATIMRRDPRIQETMAEFDEIDPQLKHLIADSDGDLRDLIENSLPPQQNDDVPTAR